MALHALLYCERLFYLEEVEEIRVADANVYAGRRLHVERLALDDETPELRSFEVSSEAWGLVGKVDAVRRRDGAWVAYEHKRGRCRRGDGNRPEAWPSDRVQAIAYAVLTEEELGEPVREARIRYHSDNVTAFIEIDDEARGNLRKTIDRARQLRKSTQRPAVTENERLCRSCSLAPVCLPEEERLAQADRSDGDQEIGIRTTSRGAVKHLSSRPTTPDSQCRSLNLTPS
jgi:CRISPR-associated protein Cas1